MKNSPLCCHVPNVTEVDDGDLNVALSAENCGAIEESYCSTLGSVGECCGGACREETAAVVNCHVQVSFGGVCPGIECGGISGGSFEGITQATVTPTVEGTTGESTEEHTTTIHPSSTLSPTLA